MPIRLSDADEMPISFAEEVVLGADRLDPDLTAGPMTVRLEGRILALDDGYLVEGSMEADGRLSCGRCLEAFPWNVSDRFSVELRHPPETGNDDVELDEADLEVIFILEDRLDVEKLAVEQVMLNLPIRVLCRPECAGLCARCGANLNNDQCRCEPEVDSRWEALRDIDVRPS